MNNTLNISPDVYERIPDLIVIAGEATIGEINTSGINDYLKSSWSKLTNEVKQYGYKTHPRIQQWRDALIKARIPVKKFPPSIEAIAKRTESYPTPFSINPIVDLYNAISMDLVLPFGAYDVDQLEGNLTLRISEGNESFTSLGSEQAETTVASEIVYSDSKDIITRQFLWRQSQKGKILDTTKRIVYVCELLKTMEDIDPKQIQNLIESKFTSLLSATISASAIYQN